MGCGSISQQDFDRNLHSGLEVGTFAGIQCQRGFLSEYNAQQFLGLAAMVGDCRINFFVRRHDSLQHSQDHKVFYARLEVNFESDKAGQVSLS